MNASPEPFSNWGVSLAEDLAVFGGLWLALQQPWIFLGLLLLFIGLAIWALPKLWRQFKRLLAVLGRLFGRTNQTPAPMHLRLPPEAWEERP